MLSSSAKEYKEALGILADCSQHIALIADAIKTQIIPKLKTKHSMIDIGAGIGVLTKQLEDSFQEITVLDINPDCEKELKASNYDVQIGDFFQFQTEKKYDLVLCSHVMYHFNEKQMKLFIDKLRSLVSPGGYCFIALIAPRGKNHEFHIKFNHNYINSKQIIEVLEKGNIHFEKIQSIPHHLTTSHLFKMKSLLKFFLIENCQTKPSALLEADEIQKINTIAEDEANQCKKGEEEYDFEQEDDYIVIPGTMPGFVSLPPHKP